MIHINQEYEDVENNVKLEKELKDDSYQSRIRRCRK